MKRTRAGALALFACVLLSGCTTNRYLAPATTFRDSTTRTISVISGFYASRNSYELEIYLTTVALDPTTNLEAKDKTGASTPLGKPVFSPASIKARLNALQLVGVYAARLCDLTNSTAPSDFSDASTALGKNLITLSNDFQSLKTTSADPTAGAYVQPVTTLLTAIGNMYLNHQRNKLVKQAILDGSHQVKVILTQVQSDLDNIFSLELSTGGNEQLATLVRAYNNDRASLSYDQRVARLAQVKAAAESASAATVSAPSQLVAAMLTANDALLAAANPPKGQQAADFATLNAALSTWSGLINALAAQIQPLVK